MHRFRSASARVCALIIGATGLMVAVAPAARAVDANPVCDAFSADQNGNPTGSALATGVHLPPLKLPNLGTATVETGTAFEAVAPGQATDLPDATQVEFPPGSGTMLDANVVEVKNIKLVFNSTGAASIGTPVVSGGTVDNPTAVVNASLLTLTLPGSQGGSTIGGGNSFFPGGSTFTSPKLTIPVTAPNTPGTISTEIQSLTLNVKVHVIALNADLAIYLDCTASGVIGSVTVKSPPPPPPGAPDAINDNASTKLGEAVDVAVLANDKPNKDNPIDVDSLVLVTQPTKGSVVVNADHTVTYMPKPNVLGVDSFKYKICSLIEPVVQQDAVPAPPAAVAPCDTATVSITINDPTPVTTTTVKQQAVSTTTVPTTVAPADQLPRTGSSSLPLAIISLVMIAAGAAAVVGGRRRRSA